MLRMFLATAVLLLAHSSSSGDELKDALAAASKHLRARDYAAAQAPLEAALKLAPPLDTSKRVEIYRMLMPSYRLLPEEDKMAEAVEYIQEYGDSATERTRTARDFAAFLHQRGKQDWAIARYEKLLTADPQHAAALAVLSTLYLRLPGDKKERGVLLEEKLKALDIQRATSKAERLAKQADAPPNAAATNWKEAARAWLEAGNHEQAKRAVERSLAAAPEKRSDLLAMYWHDGLGDVLLALGEQDQALKEFAAAVALASSEPLKRPIEAKIEKIRKPEKK